MKPFADRLNDSIERTKSVIVAGIDPVIETLPKLFLELGAHGTTTEDALYRILSAYSTFALETTHGIVAAVKPNAAFFEQYGIGGVRALMALCEKAQELGIPVILDAKRGDIGSTAQAYSAASIGTLSWGGKPIKLYNADAVTVNPFLGFDTLKPFMDDCTKYNKGIFVLVKTSNPGSGDIQGVCDRENNRTTSEKVATWLSDHAKELMGTCGFSGLGAVVGATYPEEARALRTLMPTNFFLIPGYGAQGGTAATATAGFAKKGYGGGIVNMSRGLFTFTNANGSKEVLAEELRGRVGKANGEMSVAQSPG